MNDIKIVENFFPTIIFKEIINKVDHAPAKWHFQYKDPTYSDAFLSYKSRLINPNIIEDLSCFQYRFLGPGVDSPDLRMEELFTKYISNKLGYSVNEILRINCNISTPCFDLKDNQYTSPHSDINIEHKSLVFYLHDSDGDTVLFDKFSNGDDEEIHNLKIIKRVTPMKNSCVTFDGLRYHALIPSKKNLRKIINVNYI